MNLNYLSIQLGANSNKTVVQQNGQLITYISTLPCIFFSASEVKKMHLCCYMQGKESHLSGRFFQLVYFLIINEVN